MKEAHFLFFYLFFQTCAFFLYHANGRNKSVKMFLQELVWKVILNVALLHFQQPETL